MNAINLPPYAPRLMESTRAIGYSLEAAIADIIDNSLTAKSTRIDINFFPIGQAYISIMDNGQGMTLEEIISAMQYGSKDPNDIRDISDLGRYGLGLKTASLSQCRILSVISIKNGILAGGRWDLDHIQMIKEWSLLILDEEDMNGLPDVDKLKLLENGTLVLWQQLDKLSIGEIDFVASLGLKMDRVREHIALVFHRYISGETNLKKVDIFINNNLVESADPFLLKKSTQIMDDETIIIRGDKVIVRPFILPHFSKLTESEINKLGGIDGLRRRQGFYIYRNKRLLIWGTWFRLMRQGDLSKLARVQVDIPNSLDDLWTLDIKKSTATPPEEVRKNLAKIISKIAEGSKRTWTFRGKKEVDDSKVHLWNRFKARDNGIFYAINRDHPLLESIISSMPEIKRSLNALLDQIEGTIPLNSLYIDLTNDEKICNETSINDTNIVSLLKIILSNYDSIEVKMSLYENLINTEPFCEYTELLKKAFENGELI